MILTEIKFFSTKGYFYVSCPPIDCTNYMRIYNWREPVILALLHLSGSKIPYYLKEIEQFSQMSRDDIEQYQKVKLEQLLFYAFEKVPYYHRILAESGVISGDKVHLENFKNIPVLTKEIIRREGNNLYSVDHRTRKTFENTTSGSTGEPIKFIQDVEYDEWNIATKIYFNQLLGKRVGEKEIKFWGSLRDLLEDTKGIRNNFHNFLFNRKSLNNINLTRENLDAIIREWEEFRPIIVWSQVSAIHELARYMEKNKMTFSNPPKGIIVTASVLSKDVQNYLERILTTKVYNQYGSREVGAIACECVMQDGLHIFDFFQYVEIINLDNTGNGEIIITNLRNFSMPFIRYQIGDMAEKHDSLCSCGTKTHKLGNITGRISDYFILEDGTKIAHTYFSQLFWFKPWVKQFQVIQKEYRVVICKVVVHEESNTIDMRDIEMKIQRVMGTACSVHFEFVDEIERSRSGKFRYVISEVKA